MWYPKQNLLKCFVSSDCPLNSVRGGEQDLVRNEEQRLLRNDWKHECKHKIDQVSCGFACWIQSLRCWPNIYHTAPLRIILILQASSCRAQLGLFKIPHRAGPGRYLLGIAVKFVNAYLNSESAAPASLNLIPFYLRHRLSTASNLSADKSPLQLLCLSRTISLQNGKK